MQSAMDMDTTEDLHGIVLNSAFKAMISNPSKVLVNTGDNMELSLNRNVLILFSPVIRNILSSVPCCTTPTMYLPDVSTKTIIKLRDILNKGISGDFWDVKESGDVLEAASALGIDMQRLHYGAERQASPAGEILVNIDNIGNKSRQMKKVFDQKKTEGKEIVFISKSVDKRSTSNAVHVPAVRKAIISDDSAKESTTTSLAKAAAEKEQMEQASKTKLNLGASITSAGSSKEPTVPSANTPTNVQIKKEAHATEEASTGLEEPMEQVEQVPTNLTSAVITDTEDLKNQCEKCKKAFASMTLLRYHYCSHFRGILKKKFANLFHDNKCLECFKTFANPGRLLLHIGVQHDKINEILKSKGITELPPYSATAALGGLELSSEADNTEQPSEASDDTNNLGDDQTSAISTRDIKNIPLFSAPSTKLEIIKRPTVEKDSTPITTSNTPKPSNVSLNETTSSMISIVSSVTSSANTSFDKNNDSSTECNYDLECQVCDQKLKTISLLEQHCCRHFMKELQDQYSSLMDGLKCNICYNSFKQKHSLLLHIGCKHGKINDILRQKNYAALPCPVTNTSSAAMQKQLVQIKKERLELDMKEENFNSIRSEMTEDESPGEASTDLLNETPPIPASEEASAMPTLDEILKKYRFTAGASSGSK